MSSARCHCALLGHFLHRGHAALELGGSVILALGILGELAGGAVGLRGGGMCLKRLVARLGRVVLRLPDALVHVLLVLLELVDPAADRLPHCVVFGLDHRGELRHCSDVLWSGPLWPWLWLCLWLTVLVDALVDLLVRRLSLLRSSLPLCLLPRVVGVGGCPC